MDEKKSIRREFHNLSNYFKNGLEEKNIRQGVFKNVYVDNKQNDSFILTKDECKSLCESIFNYKISRSLMLANGKPIYSYRIIECNFEYITSHNRLTETFTKYVRFTYHISSVSHDFWQDYTVYDKTRPISGFSHPIYNCLYVDEFIKNF